MCGICGILRRHAPAERELLERMCRSLAHRGPDSQGIYLEDGAGLGIRRLRIIDLKTGDQPIYNEDKSIVVVFNGEIYNFRELREELEARGHRFYTRTDTEVIPHLYEEFGPDCAKHLNGMFAFALWDQRQGEALLARDHLGIKPLYYAEVEGDLLFGSELKALLQDGRLSREIDPFALDDFLTYRYIPAPRAIFRSVKKLPPGHILRWSTSGLAVERYWDVSFSEGDAVSEGEWAHWVRSLLAEAVRMQMVSDVPLGAFLSGGIDSSIVVGLMAEASSRPVKTYSVTFRSWPGLDEGEYSRLVARHFATDHQEIDVEARVGELLPRLAYHFDEPMADPAAVPTLLMCEAARREVTVVLTGEGADELFAGYGWYAWARPRLPVRLLRVLPPAARRGLLALVEAGFRGRRGQRTLMAALLPRFEELYFQAVAGTVSQHPERHALYSPDLRRQLDGRRLEADFAYYLDHSRGYSPQGRMQYLDTKIWLADDPLTKVDRMSMAVSLEARVPFLDYRLVELAAAIPSGLKRRGSVSKHVLRRAAADLLPPAILQRPKHAFDVPLASWLRGELRSEVASLPSTEAIAGTGYFRPQAVAELVEAHLSGRRDFAMHLWCLLCFAHWHSLYARG